MASEPSPLFFSSPLSFCFHADMSLYSIFLLQQQCSACNFFDAKHLKDGMIYCEVDKWMHKFCCSPLGHSKGQYQCTVCNAFLQDDEPLDSSEESSGEYEEDE